MNFLRNDYKSGDPVAKVCNANEANRVHNILMELQVLGGRLERNLNADGKGWILVIDGGSDMDGGSDGEGGPPPGYEFPGPSGADYVYQVYQRKADSGSDQVYGFDWTRAHA